MNLRSSLGVLRRQKNSLYRRLMRSMSALILILLAITAGLLFLLGQISIPGKAEADALGLQMEYFLQSMQTYWNNLTVQGIDFSSDVSSLIESGIRDGTWRYTDFSSYNQRTSDSETIILGLLQQKVLQTDCSGAFVVLYNPFTRQKSTLQGVYVMKDYLHLSNPQLYLYRGPQRITDDTDFSLHGKWHMMVEKDLIPEFEERISEAFTKPAEECAHYSSLVTMPGTDEKAVLLTVPLKGSDGQVYGLCGFEVSRRYFRAENSQPSNLPQLICLLSDSGMPLDSSTWLSCGKNYAEPSGILTASPISNGLSSYSSDSERYAGLCEDIDISYTGTSYRLSVMYPLKYYQETVAKSVLQLILLVLSALTIGIFFCRYFSRQYVRPLISSLEALRDEEKTNESFDIEELDDFSDHLKRQRQAHQNVIDELKKQNESSEKEVSRLAYDRKREIDPLVYRSFTEGMLTLTPTEMIILNLYADGKSSKEIMEQLGITNNTLRFHNKNLYSKLDVHSKKQAVLYANVWRNDKKVLKKTA